MAVVILGFSKNPKYAGMHELLNVYLQLKTVLFERTQHTAEPGEGSCIM